jgi:hypothetical protein
MIQKLRKVCNIGASLSIVGLSLSLSNGEKIATFARELSPSSNEHKNLEESHWNTRLRLPVKLNGKIFSQPVIAQRDWNPFPLIGGVTLGKIEYLKFEIQPSYKLEKAFEKVRYFQEGINFDKRMKRPFRYSYITSDINGDGKKDAFVFMQSSIGSGSGGFHVWIFQAKKNSYELVSSIMHNGSLVIMPEKSFGWNNILRVPGKIGFDPDSFYCIYKNNDNDTNRYKNCINIPKNSVILGKIIKYDTNKISHQLTKK